MSQMKSYDTLDLFQSKKNLKKEREGSFAQVFIKLELSIFLWKQNSKKVLVKGAYAQFLKNKASLNFLGFFFHQNC